jgi:hypothetical protein
MMSHLCNRRVREFLILARTWYAFGLPSKTGCDTLFLVTTPCSSCLLWNTHLVPTTFWLGRGTKCHTSFLVKLLSSSCIATI